MALLVLTGVALALTGWVSWRLGIRMLAGVLGAAGLLRLFLPERDAGMLAVRHRLLDAGFYVLMAVLLLFLAGSIPDAGV